MGAEGPGAALLAYLATYALHSTLLIGLVWLALRRLDPGRVLLRERLLKIALVGGFATALLQQGLGGLPLPARWEWRTPLVSVRDAAVPTAGQEERAEQARAAIHSRADSLRAPAGERSLVESLEGSFEVGSAGDLAAGDLASRAAGEVARADRAPSVSREATAGPTGPLAVLASALGLPHWPVPGESTADQPALGHTREASREQAGLDRDPESDIEQVDARVAADAEARGAPIEASATQALDLMRTALFLPEESHAPQPRLDARHAPPAAQDALLPSGNLSRAGAGIAPEGGGILAHASRWAPSLWTGLIAAAVGALLLARARLERHLRGRRRLVRGPLVEELARLQADAGMPRPVRLFTAPHIASPLCVGGLRPSIFVPTRAALELTRGELRAMLAHELAHVARRDPLWIQLVWVIEKACFFQPLNRWARRELQASFELACDAWAVRRTGEPFELARCLARVASWVSGPLPAPAAALAMADGDVSPRGRSRLALRIERLLAPPRQERTAQPLALAACALVMLALIAPGVRARPVGPALAPRAQPAGTPPLPVAQPEPTLPAGASQPAASTPLPAWLERLQALGARAQELQIDALEERAAQLRAEIDGLKGSLSEVHARLGERTPTPRALELMAELEHRLASLDLRLERMDLVLRLEQASLLRRDSFPAPSRR